MRVFQSVNAINTICVMIAIYVVYHLLLQDNLLHLSITSIIKLDKHLAKHGHFLIVGLLPIYIACMIFGAVTMAICTATFLEHSFKRLGWKKPSRRKLVL